MNTLWVNQCVAADAGNYSIQTVVKKLLETLQPSSVHLEASLVAFLWHADVLKTLTDTHADQETEKALDLVACLETLQDQMAQEDQ